MPDKRCGFNRSMQHHLICSKGGVYDSRETVWAFGDAEARHVASLEGGRLDARFHVRMPAALACSFHR